MLWNVLNLKNIKFSNENLQVRLVVKDGMGKVMMDDQKNACKFIKEEQTFYPKALEFSNLPTECPITKVLLKVLSLPLWW